MEKKGKGSVPYAIQAIKVWRRCRHWQVLFSALREVELMPRVPHTQFSMYPAPGEVRGSLSNSSAFHSAERALSGLRAPGYCGFRTLEMDVAVRRGGKM